MEIIKIDSYRFEIPKTGEMRVPARIYADDKLIKAVSRDETYKQLVNVAKLPGIIKAAMAMPDIHWGYGFPIGGVAAFDIEEGIISPGGVGYDINCGVRLAVTDLEENEVKSRLAELADALFASIPCGVGSKGKIRLSAKELKKVLKHGSRWAVSAGFGDADDLEATEDGGCLEMADPAAVSDRALERGRPQLGTLGSGNHFLEIGVVDEIFDNETASVFGLAKGKVTILLHSGSRGLGHQVCDDSLASMARYANKTGLQLPDRQLACAPIRSPEGEAYFGAMAAAANYAWANRQILMHLARETIMRFFSISPNELGFRLVYDVCHNIAKIETHNVKGTSIKVCVHRKGATRAFAPGDQRLSDRYRRAGQPILIPGDMGRASYVLAGTPLAMEETFGSTCHGAGRILSRHAAKKAAKGRVLHEELKKKGIIVRWTGRSTMAEEMPDAYKDVSDVVSAVHGAGISKKVARLRPLAVIKG